MAKVVTGTDLLIAVDNAVFNIRPSLTDKLKHLSILIQPGPTYNELVTIIRKDIELPQQYVEALETIGILFPDKTVFDINPNESAH
jgi:hypothetical protein